MWIRAQWFIVCVFRRNPLVSMSGTDAYADGDTVSPPKEPPAVMPGVRVRSEVSVMSETGDRSAFPFDWKAFERMFGANFTMLSIGLFFFPGAKHLFNWFQSFLMDL